MTDLLPTSIRPRAAYLAFMLLAFMGGLAAHFSAHHLPHFIGENLPDTLWALWVFLMVLVLWPHLSPWRATVGVLSFADAVEFSQLYHAPWIDRVRATLFGKLVLGDTFQWSDLVCYSIGIGVGLTIDITVRKWAQRLTSPGVTPDNK